MSEPTETFQHKISETVRAFAATFPETVEGTSCVNRAFKAGGKNFVFLGEKEGECNVRLKLEASVPEIKNLAENDPDRWQVGKGGWALFRFPPDSAPPAADLQRWITESFCLLAPKKVVALLDG